MALPVGQTIKDRYRIDRVLSTQGGFGNTYLAFDQIRGHEVVIKASKTAADIEQDALLSELKILLSLDHPRLPKVYDGFFHERQLCVTMQYIPGRDVSSYLVMAGPERRAEPPDRPAALRWIVQTLEALAYLHGRGIVHRDVRPANLRVHTETGDIFLLDFGISQQNNELVVRGFSRSYAAPEQRTRAGKISPATDVYAVGALLHTFLTGAPPPERNGQTEPLLFLDSDRHDIPEELKAMTRKALRADPADRYPDAQAMLEDLKRLPYARSGPSPAWLWGLTGFAGVLLVGLIFTITMLVTGQLSPPVAGGASPQPTAAALTPAAQQVEAAALPPGSLEPTSQPAPTVAPTVIAADAVALLAPTAAPPRPAPSLRPRSSSRPPLGPMLCARSRWRDKSSATRST